MDESGTALPLEPTPAELARAAAFPVFCLEPRLSGPPGIHSYSTDETRVHIVWLRHEHSTAAPVRIGDVEMRSIDALGANALDAAVTFVARVTREDSWRQVVENADQATRSRNALQSQRDAMVRERIASIQAATPYATRLAVAGEEIDFVAVDLGTPSSWAAAAVIGDALLAVVLRGFAPDQVTFTSVI